jgi:hypothetical protein
MTCQYASGLRLLSSCRPLRVMPSQRARLFDVFSVSQQLPLARSGIEPLGDAVSAQIVLGAAIAATSSLSLRLLSMVSVGRVSATRIESSPLVVWNVPATFRAIALVSRSKPWGSHPCPSQMASHARPWTSLPPTLLRMLDTG